MNLTRLFRARLIIRIWPLAMCFVLTTISSAYLKEETHLTGFAEINGAKLYYEMKGEGHPVVLIHGGLVDSRLWDDQFEQFAKYYKVVRYDLRCFGKSGMAQGPFSHIEDLQALLKYLKIERATVVGLSLGGVIATDFALEYPHMVDSLILIGSALRGDKRLPDKRITEAYETALREGPEKYVEMYMQTPLFAAVRNNPSLRARMGQMMLDNFKSLASFSPDVMQFPTIETIERLGGIRVPTLVIVGSKDHPDVLAVADILQKKLKSAQKVIIQGASHHPNIEKPAVFNRVVLNFVKKRARSAVNIHVKLARTRPLATNMTKMNHNDLSAYHGTLYARA